MTRDNLLAISRNTTTPMPPEFSRETYDYLINEMEQSVHGQRFNFREFSLEPIDESRPSVMDTSTPYVVTNTTEPEQLKWIAHQVRNMAMLEPDGKALTDAMGNVYYSDKVQKHLQLGGSILWATNHITYADKIAEISALALARLHYGEQNPNETQDVFTHRLTSLFRHDAINLLYEYSGYEHFGGMVSEDVILPLASDIQTMPSSASGRDRFIQAIKDGKNYRKEMNRQTSNTFNQLIKLGGRSIHLAVSGTQAKVNENGQLEEKKVNMATCALINGLNRDGNEYVLTIPMFLYIDPFEKANADLPINPQPSPFAILEPRFLRSARDVHDMMSEIVEAGNMYKPSGKPKIIYDAPIPKILSPYFHSPRIIESHSV